MSDDVTPPTGTTAVEQTTSVTVQPQAEKKLAWTSKRVWLAVVLLVLIVWWRMRQGESVDEILNDSASLYNTFIAVAMGSSVVGVIAATLKGAKPLTTSPSAARKTVPTVTEATTTTKTTTTASTPPAEGE